MSGFPNTIHPAPAPGLRPRDSLTIQRAWGAPKHQARGSSGVRRAPRVPQCSRGKPEPAPPPPLPALGMLAALKAT